MEGILNLENWRKFGNDWVGYLAKDLPVQELLTIANKDRNVKDCYL